MSEIKVRGSFLPSEVAKSKIEKITKRVFKRNPTIKLPKVSSQTEFSNPKKSLIKKLDIEFVIGLDTPYSDISYLSKNSSKLCISHILGAQNIKKLIGNQETNLIKRRIRNGFIKGIEKSHLIKPMVPSIVDAGMKKRFSSLNLQDFKKNLNISDTKKLNKTNKFSQSKDPFKSTQDKLN